MGLTIDIVDFKCFNELKNGKVFTLNPGEYTPNLVGNVGEFLLIQFSVEMQINAFSGLNENWNLTKIDATHARIERQSGSFTIDGIIEGNRVRFQTNWDSRLPTRTIEFTADVDFISEDGLVLECTVTGGTQTTTGQVSNVGIELNFVGDAVENANTASLLKFGLINNDEAFNFISKTTDAQQIYYAGGISGIHSMIPLGKYRDWVSGSVFIQDTTAADPYTQEFEINHTLINNPWYIIDFKSNIENNITPEILEGENSFKYAFESEFRKTLTDVASAKKQSLDKTDGVTGWFGENFNGFNNLYQVDSIAYSDVSTGDPLTAISINGQTKITIVISKISGSIVLYDVGAYISYLPASEDEYKNTLTDMQSNFLYKREIINTPATSEGDLSSSLVAGVLTLEYIVQYTSEEKLRLTEDSEYIVWVQIQDSALSAGNSDRVALLADSIKNYTDTDFIVDFGTFTEHEFFEHNQ